MAQNKIEPPVGHLLLFDRTWLPDATGIERLCLKLRTREAAFNVGAPFEERPVFTASADAVELARFRQYYQQRYGHPLDDAHVAVPQLLRNLRLAAVDEAAELRPTVLGLLLFSSHPERWISGAFLDVAVYGGEEPDSENLLDAKTIHGTLVEQIERTMDYLKLSPFLPVAARKDDAGRVDYPAYSLRALQEGLVNALVHRDYGISGSQVRVMLFPSRIEISNPGRLSNTLKLGARRPDLKQIGDSLRLTIFSAHH